MPLSIPLHMAERYTQYDEGVELIDEGLGSVTISHEDNDSIPATESLDFSTAQRRHLEFGSRSHSYEPSPIVIGNDENREQRRNALSWRSDPAASFSDWTIEVATIEHKQITCSSFYHCHSNVLVWGPRKSDVFIQLFQERMRQVPQTTITQIELPPSEAQVFPVLLDYLYCETSFSLSADHICPVYILAERFQNEQLMSEIQKIVENSLDFEQSMEFLSHARRYSHREKIENLALFTNSKICGYLVRYPVEARKVLPELLAHILHRRAQVMKVLKGEDPRKFSGEWEIERSKSLSLVVAECCYGAASSPTRKYTLTRATFERLTNPVHLPALDCQAALKLLQVDGHLLMDEGSPHVSEQEELSSFESRCVQALVANWRFILGENESSVFSRNLSTLKSHVLASILTQVSLQYERKLAENRPPPSHEILETLKTNEFHNPRNNKVENRSISSLRDSPKRNKEVSSPDWVTRGDKTPDWASG